MCIRRRRDFQRAGRRHVDKKKEKITLQMAKKELNTAIRSSQEKAWREMLKAVDKDVWGLS